MDAIWSQCLEVYVLRPRTPRILAFEATFRLYGESAQKILSILRVAKSYTSDCYLPLRLITARALTSVRITRGRTRSMFFRNDIYMPVESRTYVFINMLLSEALADTRLHPINCDIRWIIELELERGWLQRFVKFPTYTMHTQKYDPISIWFGVPHWEKRRRWTLSWASLTEKILVIYSGRYKDDWERERDRKRELLM